MLVWVATSADRVAAARQSLRKEQWQRSKPRTLCGPGRATVSKRGQSPLLREWKLNKWIVDTGLGRLARGTGWRKRIIITRVHTNICWTFVEDVLCFTYCAKPELQAQVPSSLGEAHAPRDRGKLGLNMGTEIHSRFPSHLEHYQLLKVGFHRLLSCSFFSGFLYIPFSGQEFYSWVHVS